MKDAQMIDEKTKSVKIDLLMYNPSFGCFTKVTVTFEFDLGGTINLDTEVENFNANLYETDADEFRFILEIVFIVLIGLQCLGAVKWDRDRDMGLLTTTAHSIFYSNMDRVREGSGLVLLAHFGGHWDPPSLWIMEPPRLWNYQHTVSRSSSSLYCVLPSSVVGTNRADSSRQWYEPFL